MDGRTTMVYSGTIVCAFFSFLSCLPLPPSYLHSITLHPVTTRFFRTYIIIIIFKLERKGKSKADKEDEGENGYILFSFSFFFRCTEASEAAHAEHYRDIY
ncbi:hypothetical protein C8J57DRAFT_413648 [Mycena rebaudengoi]|nr:hypothetical protein C8J57DRAFT_413648 [Mycena rebaudengoi]